MVTTTQQPTDATTSTTPPTETEGATMQAIVQHEYGSSEVLQIAQLERPSIAPDEVLVEVHAAGVDRGTWHLLAGLPYVIRIAGYGLRGPKTPVPGLDVAGRVVAVGDDVTRFAPGDEVFGIAMGSFAEYAPAKAGKLAHKPANMSWEQAGVAAVSGITALQAVEDVGGVTPGMRVLVVGASGGVGTYAVQIAKAHGAHVTGVAGTRNLEMVRGLGADEVVDHRREDVTDRSETFDLIIDIGGMTKVSRLRGILAPEGTIVFVGGEGGNRWTGGVGRQVRASMLSPFVKQDLKMFMSTEAHTFMERLAAHLESGAVVPAIGDRFALDEVPMALAQMEVGHTRGKSVVVVRPAG